MQGFRHEFKKKSAHPFQGASPPCSRACLPMPYMQRLTIIPSPEFAVPHITDLQARQLDKRKDKTNVKRGGMDAVTDRIVCWREFLD